MATQQSTRYLELKAQMAARGYDLFIDDGDILEPAYRRYYVYDPRKQRIVTIGSEADIAAWDADAVATPRLDRSRDLAARVEALGCQLLDNRATDTEQRCHYVEYNNRILAKGCSPKDITDWCDVWERAPAAEMEAMLAAQGDSDDDDDNAERDGKPSAAIDGAAAGHDDQRDERDKYTFLLNPIGERLPDLSDDIYAVKALGRAISRAAEVHDESTILGLSGAVEVIGERLEIALGSVQPLDTAVMMEALQAKTGAA
jgi:hypothetical protein